MVRDLDIVVFGATGDTGVVGCCYLYFKGKSLGITSWAPAARNLSKLKTDVLDRFEGLETGSDGLAPSEPIQADSNDYKSLVSMCSRAKCIVACAGPFSKFGEGVVRACVEAGTDYVDITGEVPWVERMKSRYGQEAEKKGVSILSLAGYDSIPPDLTAYLAAKALEKEGERLQRYEAFVGSSGGVVPSGTVDTALGFMAEGKRSMLKTATFGAIDIGGEENVPLLDEAGNGITFAPQAEQDTLKNNLFWSYCPGYSQLAGQFCMGHFMASINVHTVHHTAAKEGYAGFVYRERMGGVPRGPLTLYGLVPVLMATLGAMLLGPLSLLPGFSTLVLKLRDLVNPAMHRRLRARVFNGYAPTGTSYVHGYGMSKSGRKVNVKMKSQYDPGLGFTMLTACTVAAMLVKRAGTSSKAKPGFNSCVVALGGDALADALRASGVTLEVTMPEKKAA